MKFTEYFIRHPVAAVILNAMLVLIGWLCLGNLGLREYPDVSFPKISVSVRYPNAGAETVETSVTNILEDKLAGIEGVDIIRSNSYQEQTDITLVFKAGTSMDRALASVRDKVSAAVGVLPPDIRPPQVERAGKGDWPPFMMIAVESETMGQAELFHFVSLNIANSLRSISGIAAMNVWGQQYTWRVTPDAGKLKRYGVNADELYQAIFKEKSSYPVGRYQDRIPVSMRSTLKTAEDFDKILLKPVENLGRNHVRPPVWLKDVAKTALTLDDSTFRIRLNGKTGLCLAVTTAGDANPLEVSDAVNKKVAELQQRFQGTVTLRTVVDQAQFVRSSLNNVTSAVIEAIVLVLAVVFLFLRNLRSTMVPLVTVPVSLLGSLIFLTLFGFSLNLMTLLAVVLAVGLVVDDAIVVLENISRHTEEGMSPFEAAIKGAREIAPAVVGMTLTLTAVYIPMAFVKGVIGQLFIEFALALAGGVLVSGVTALTLSPLMCSKVLGASATHSNHRWLLRIEEYLERLGRFYARALEFALAHRGKCLAAVAAVPVVSLLMVNLLPKETVPKEDRGIVGLFTPKVSGESMDDLETKINVIEKGLPDIPEKRNIISFIGDWGASTVIPLKPVGERRRRAETIRQQIQDTVQVNSADVFAWATETGLPGFERSHDGNEIILKILTADSYKNLFTYAEGLKKDLNDSKVFQSVTHDLSFDDAGYEIETDREALARLDLTRARIAKTVEIFFSGNRGIETDMDGILYPVTIRGAQMPWSLDSLYVINSKGHRISLAAIAKLVMKTRPAELNHYNRLRSVSFTLRMKPGALVPEMMEQARTVTAATLPHGFQTEWGGAAKAYLQSSSTMLSLFLLAVVFIYAVLAVQFGSFKDPLIILTTVPLACFGGLLVLWLCGGSLNIYSQVGLITLVGIITKHGILIVEFVNQLLEQGVALEEAVRQGALLRLRPILMTTAAMFIGTVPLVISSDAGSETRRAIGEVLLGGLAVGTVFTVFAVPCVCMAMKRMSLSRIKSRLFR